MTTDGATLVIMALIFGPVLWAVLSALCRSASGAVVLPNMQAGPVAPVRPPGDRQSEPESSAPGAIPATGAEPGAKPRVNPEYLGNDFRAVYVLGFIKSDVAAGIAVRAARECYGQAHVPYLGLHMTTARGRVRKTAPADSSAR